MCWQNIHWRNVSDSFLICNIDYTLANVSRPRGCNNSFNRFNYWYSIFCHSLLCVVLCQQSTPISMATAVCSDVSAVSRMGAVLYVLMFGENEFCSYSYSKFNIFEWNDFLIYWNVICVFAAEYKLCITFLCFTVTDSLSSGVKLSIILLQISIYSQRILRCIDLVY